MWNSKHQVQQIVQSDLSNCTYNSTLNFTYNSTSNCTSNLRIDCTFNCSYNYIDNCIIDCPYNFSFNCINNCIIDCAYNFSFNCINNCIIDCSYNFSFNCINNCLIFNFTYNCAFRNEGLLSIGMLFICEKLLDTRKTEEEKKRIIFVNRCFNLQYCYRVV